MSVRFGSQGSIIDWLLVPRLGDITKALGNALVELEQMRTLDVVRGVADGRLDFGIVREDSLPAESQHWRLGSVGYALVAPNAFWRGSATVRDVVAKAPLADLLPGGQFSTNWQQWLGKEKLRPQVMAWVFPSRDLAGVVRAGRAAAVLQKSAAVDFDPTGCKHGKITVLSPAPWP